VEELGVDLLSISSHKIYGPKGVGALYIRKGVEITPQPHGGHHERNMRAGTENIAAIAGFAKAVTYLNKNLKEYERVMVMRDRLYNGLSDRIKDMRLNGHPQKRLPNTVNIGFKDTEEEGLLVNLDTKGICASSGSACTARDLKGSHVLEAMGLPKQIVRGSVRFSLGIDTSERDIEYCIKEIPLIIQRLRSVYKSTATA
jgi:cysteine desulfurase